MRNILALLGAATVAFLVVGWYLGWYKVTRVPSPEGKQAVHVDISPDKITNDAKRVAEQGGELVDQIRDKSKGNTQPTQAGPATNFFTPTPTPAEKDKGLSSGGWRPIGDK